MNELIYKDESYKIIGCCMEVYNTLGLGLLEIVYKDALEYEFKKNGIEFVREKQYPVNYKDIILPHNFFADIFVYDKIILEIKCVSRIVDDHIKQTLNFLGISKCRLGMIVNFGEESLKFKRLVLNLSKLVAKE